MGGEGGDGMGMRWRFVWRGGRGYDCRAVQYTNEVIKP
jgi:hypothetical protein